MDRANAVPCTVMRGGTSKGLYFLKKDLPEDGQQRDALLMRIMGSPDPKQIDGLGGAASLKVRLHNRCIILNRNPDVKSRQLQRGLLDADIPPVHPQRRRRPG